MAKPHWLILMKLMKRDRVIIAGLIIPYLYGAYKRLGYDINSIEDLLLAICTVPAKEFPVIEKCDVIKFNVIKSEPAVYTHKYRKKEVKICSDDMAVELVISYSTQLGRDFKKVCNSLKASYQAMIDAETYSYKLKENEWTKFDKSDHQRIDSIK